MTLNLKKTLLTGTALFVMGSLAVTAQAADLTLVGDSIWAGTGAVAGADGGDNVDLGSFTLTVTDNGSANDGTAGPGNFQLGAVTDTGTGNLTTTTTNVNDDLTVSIGSVNIAGNMIVSTANANNLSNATTVTGNTTIGGALSVTNDDTDSPETTTLTVGGNLVVTGATTVTAGNFAGANSRLTVTGNANVGTGLTLNDGTSGTATFALNGTAGQTITGNISGAAPGEGTILISNTNATNGVTFQGDIGGATNTLETIVINNNGNNQRVVFQGDVRTVTGLVLGDNSGTDQITVVFNTAGGDAALVGPVSSGASEDTVISFIGGNDVNATSTIAADTLSIGLNTTLNAAGNITGGVDLESSGATLALGDGVDVNGTVDSNTSGAGILTSAATGVNVSQITGAVGSTNRLTSVTLTGNGEMQFDDTVRATTISMSAAGLFDFNGNVTGNINFGADGTAELANGITITGNINNTTGTDDRGNLVLQAAGGGTIINGNVGATNALGDMTLGGAGETDFNGFVNATLLDFNNNAGLVFFAGNTTVDVINFNDGDGTVTFGDGATYQGNIIDDNDDEGTVEFEGNSTVNGDLGQTGNGIKAVTVTSGAGQLVTVNGVVVALNTNIDGQGGLTANAVTGAVNFGANGTLRLQDNGTISGAVANDSGSIGRGNLYFIGSGAVGAVGVDAAELNSITLAGTGETVTTGNFQAANTTNLNSNLLSVTGTVDVDAGQRITTMLTGTNTIGHINASSTVSVASGALLNVIVDPNVYVSTGDTFTVIDGAGGGSVATLNNGNITDDSFLLSFAQNTSNTNDLVLISTRGSTVGASDNENNEEVGETLDAIRNNGDDTLDQVQSNLAAASTQEDVNDVLDSLLPNVDSGTVQAGFNASVQSLNVNDTRLASLRDPSTPTGMVAGQMGKGTYAWAQGFGNEGDQGARDNINGYQSETYGVAIGADTKNIMTDATLGMAFSYAMTDVDSDNANDTTSEIDSYQFSLYGDYDITRHSYLEGMLGYAYNQIDQTRHDVGAIANNDATADYDSNQYIAYAELGRAYALNRTLNFTPSILSHYQHITIDDYTEEGAGGAGLAVDNEDLDILEFGVGAELSWLLRGKGGSIVKPAIKGGYRYDVIGDKVQSTANFTGGGPSFKTEGFEPDQSTTNAGASLSYAMESNWELSADYDYQFKADYDAHSAFLRAGYKW